MTITLCNGMSELGKKCHVQSLRKLHMLNANRFTIQDCSYGLTSEFRQLWSEIR